MVVRVIMLPHKRVFQTLIKDLLTIFCFVVELIVIPQLKNFLLVMNENLVATQ